MHKVVPAEIEPQELSSQDLSKIKEQFVEDLKLVAPDLGSNRLAERYSDGLFNKLLRGSPANKAELAQVLEREFYDVGKNVLGPLVCQFVSEVLEENTSGPIVFLARDATPFYHVAKSLVGTDTNRYTVDTQNLKHETFHRKLWGVDDEQGDREEAILTAEHPLVNKLLRQMGFGSGEPVTIVDVGAWGSMADHLRRVHPEEDFNLYFFYTHLPEFISGYINRHARGEDGILVPDSDLEALADSWEAFPKYTKRQTKISEVDERIVFSPEGSIIDSPYLHAAHEAAIQGLEDAAVEYVQNGEAVDPHAEIVRLSGLSDLAKQGEFTGILPEHTETWSEGPKWKREWPWGKIPPLK